jgi:Spy/CpxP family protein refolding chaperone
MSIFQHKVIIPALFLMGTAALTVAGGHHHEFDPHKKADKIVARLEKELKLSKEQKVQVHKLAHEVADRFKELHAKGPEMHGGFVKQLRSGSVDTAALNKEMAERDARARERHALLIGKFAELHAILTPEQREKLAKHMEKRKKKMRKHMGHW